MNALTGLVLDDLLKQSAGVLVIVQALRLMVDMGERVTYAVTFAVACGVVVAVSWPLALIPSEIYTLILAAATITVGAVGGHEIIDKTVSPHVDIDRYAASRRDVGKVSLRKG